MWSESAGKKPIKCSRIVFGPFNSACMNPGFSNCMEKEPAICWCLAWFIKARNRSIFESDQTERFAFDWGHAEIDVWSSVVCSEKGRKDEKKEEKNRKAALCSPEVSGRECSVFHLLPFYAGSVWIFTARGNRGCKPRTPPRLQTPRFQQNLSSVFVTVATTFESKLLEVEAAEVWSQHFGFLCRFDGMKPALPCFLASLPWLLFAWLRGKLSVVKLPPSNRVLCSLFLHFFVPTGDFGCPWLS